MDQEMKDTIPFQGAINFDDAVRADKAIFHKESWSKSGRLAITILGILTILYMAAQFSFLATLAFVAISAALLSGHTDKLRSKEEAGRIAP